MEPASWVFQVMWTPIYILGAITLVWSTRPSMREWAQSNSTWALPANYLANALYLVLLLGEYGGLWPAVAVILCVIIPTLIYAHRRLHVGAAYAKCVTDGVPYFEAAVVHTYVSMYLGWACVAALETVVLALIPPSRSETKDVGLSPVLLMVAAQVAAAAVGAAALVRIGDAAFAAPIATGLIAIGTHQLNRSGPGYGLAIPYAALALGPLLLVAALAIAARRIHVGCSSRFMCAAATAQEEKKALLS